jgi:hypothetical protein
MAGLDPATQRDRVGDQESSRADVYLLGGRINAAMVI